MSGVAMGLHPQIADRDQPLGLQPLVDHPGLGRQRPRQAPVAVAESILGVRPPGQPAAVQNRFVLLTAVRIAWRLLVPRANRFLTLVRT